MRRKYGLGFDLPGIPTVRSPHLGDLLLERFEEHIADRQRFLRDFQLMDRLQKPVVNFDLHAFPNELLELQEFLAGFPYSFLIMTRKGLNLSELSPRGNYAAFVYISRFPKLIEFIRKYEKEIENDLWGLLYGYPLAEVHQFTYDWETWSKRKQLERGIESKES